MITTAALGRERTPRRVRLDVALSRSLASVALWLMFALIVALSLLAQPRRTGDAHQYLAMASQLAQARPPSLSPGEATEFRGWLEAQAADSGFPGGASAIRQPALVHDGRQEFSHFWLLPLLASPATRLGDLVGLHPIVAFTVTNALLLGASLLACSRVFGQLATLLLLASPLVWFVGKAQVEVFTVALLALAMAAAARGRWAWAGVSAAIAATQNLPIAATIPLFWAGGAVVWQAQRPHERLAHRPDRATTQRALLLAAGAIFIALIHPAYYFLQLGVVTPQQLNGGIAGTAPGWTRALAPLADPDIGFIPWLPVTTTVVVAGYLLLARAHIRDVPFDRNLALAALVAMPIALWFLAVFAQTTNVNSGGTVHISRYALWLLPLTLPVLSVVSRQFDPRGLPIALIAALALVAAYLGYFRPDQPENYVNHSPQAAWLIANASALYHPLPEIFVERTLHIDGGPRASATDPDCQIIFLVAAAPDQPCALTETEQALVDHAFADGALAAWVRRAADGARSVSPALVSP
jgi:hypothetical protein